MQACALGRGSVRRDKIEGDGATLLCILPLRRVLYRPDWLAPARTRFTIINPANRAGELRAAMAHRFVLRRDRRART